MHIVQSLWLDVAIGMIPFELFKINPTQWDCIFLYFAGKAKKLEDKMVQKLQEDVDMGDEDI